VLTGVVGGGQRESVRKYEGIERQLVADDDIFRAIGTESGFIIDSELRNDSVSVDKTQYVFSVHSTALVAAEIHLQHNKLEHLIEKFVFID